MPTTFTDNFNRLLMGTTGPNGNPYTGSGVWTIDSSMYAKLPGGSLDALVCDFGTANVDISTIQVSDPSPNNSGVVVRWQDANNFVRIVVDGNSGGNIFLQVDIGGSLNVWQTTAITFGLNKVIRCVCFGNVYDVYYDGAFLFSYTDVGNSFLGVTFHGLEGNATTALLDNLSVTTGIANPNPTDAETYMVADAASVAKDHPTDSDTFTFSDIGVQTLDPTHPSPTDTSVVMDLAATYSTTGTVPTHLTWTFDNNEWSTTYTGDLGGAIDTIEAHASTTYSIVATLRNQFGNPAIPTHAGVTASSVTFDIAHAGTNVASVTSTVTSVPNGTVTFTFPSLPQGTYTGRFTFNYTGSHIQSVPTSATVILVAES